MSAEVVPDEISPAAPSRWLLRFTPLWEARYEQDRSAARTRSALLTGWLALLLDDVFVVGDWTIDESLLWRAVLARLLVFTPITLVCLWVIARYRTPVACELSKFVIIVTAGAGALWIVTPFSAAAAVIGQLGLMLIMVFGTTVLRIGFPYALATTAVLLFEELSFLWHDALLRAGEASTCGSLLFATALVTLLASYRLERSDRLNYRLLFEAQSRRDALEASNVALEKTSSLDGLTGLSNRRHFDAYAVAAFREARAGTAPISIVMADIDHFKRLNDSRGHLAGDAVLVAVAAIVQSCMRESTDLAARFGGEEFVMILPATDEVQAHAVAQRLVDAVRASRLPLPDGGEPVSVTISCGVASVRAGEAASPTALLDRADHALYEAKRQGRDRVARATADL